MVRPVTTAPRVAVIVLAWNGRRWIDRCLRSLAATAYPALTVQVVDNGSRDGTPDLVAAAFPHVLLDRRPRNLGVAAGNNVGIRWALAAGADYVGLLNQDTWVEPGWLAPLVRAAEADPTIGVLSPLQLTYESDAPDPGFARVVADLPGDGIREVPTAPGAALLVRRGVFEKVGLFDPLYFAYFEEADFCRRARAQGFRTVVMPAGRIHHWHSLLHPAEMPLHTQLLSVRNQFIFALKDPVPPIRINLVRCAGLWRRELAYCLRHPRGVRGGAARAAALAWIFVSLALNLPRALRHRAQERGRAAYL
jgi:GT2 family glycosyltransferase